MEPLARGWGTEGQCIQFMALMYIAVPGTVHCYHQGSRPPTLLSTLPQLVQLHRADSLTLLFIMPRIRGRPRRGTGWRAPETRRKRHQRFVRAFQAAKKNRRGGATFAPLSPRTLLEEDLPMIPVVPTTHSVTPTTASTPDNLPQPDTTLSEFYAACIVEEEPPDLSATEHKHGPPPECTTREPELNNEDVNPERISPPPPSMLHHDHLQLIFDLRSLVDDQAFRTVSISQRLDMLFAAYSEASPRRQCPTCAQPFTLPGNGGTPTN
jgi:hypothetical protein